MTLRSVLVLGAICLASLLLMLFFVLPADQQYIDEAFHQAQIQRFLDGDFSRVPQLTVLPGYHAAVTAMAWPAGIESLRGLRVLSALLALGGLMLALVWLQRDGADRPLLRCLQILLCPIIWPFWFLLYTDLASAALVMAGLLLLTAGRLLWLAALGVVALAWRQTSLIWWGLFGLMALEQSGLRSQFVGTNRSDPEQSWRVLAVAAWRLLLKVWPLLLPLVAFAVFVTVNDGIVVGDRAAHRIRGLNFLQVYFMLLVVFVLLLPLHLANAPAIGRLLRRYPLLVILGLVMGVHYVTGFAIVHPYNDPGPGYFLRNQLLGLLDESIWLRIVSAFAIAWAALSIAVTPLRRPAHYWLYPVTVLSLLTMGLIEQRYYIVPLMLFLMFRQLRSDHLEWSLLAWAGLGSVLISWGIATMRFFP